MYYVYILKSLKNGKFYKGITNDVNRRINQHLQGKSPTTRNMLPIKLIYVHECQDRSEARVNEKFFKSGIGREIIGELSVFE